MAYNSPQFSNFVKFRLENVQNCSLSTKAVEITLYEVWGSPKEMLLVYYFSLPDEGDENKIYHFLSFSVCFMDLKRDEGANTDLMFQFCLRKRKYICINRIDVQSSTPVWPKVHTINASSMWLHNRDSFATTTSKYFITEFDF